MITLHQLGKFYIKLVNVFLGYWTHLSETRYVMGTVQYPQIGGSVQPNTFSLWISLRRCEILTFMASSSSSGTWGMVSGSVSSGPWKVSSVRGMYHLLSYCWFFLQWGNEKRYKGRSRLINWRWVGGETRRDCKGIRWRESGKQFLAVFRCSLSLAYCIVAVPL